MYGAAGGNIPKTKKKNHAKIKNANVTAYERTREITKTKRVGFFAERNVPKTVYVNQAKIKHANTE